MRNGNIFRGRENMGESEKTATAAPGTETRARVHLVLLQVEQCAPLHPLYGHRLFINAVPGLEDLPEPAMANGPAALVALVGFFTDASVESGYLLIVAALNSLHQKFWK